MDDKKADKEEIIFAKRQAAKDKVKHGIKEHTDKGMIYYRDLERDIIGRKESEVTRERAQSAHAYSSSRM